MAHKDEGPGGDFKQIAWEYVSGQENNGFPWGPHRLPLMMNFEGVSLAADKCAGGFVEDIQIISTSIRTLEGNFVRIPNETVFTSSIINYTSNPVRRFEYTVGISYADDADKAMQVIKDLINEHPLALVNPAPQVYVGSLGDSSVDIIVRIWAPSTEWFGLKMEMLWKIKQAFDAAGIEIPFPQRVVWYGTDNENIEQETSGLPPNSDQES